MRNLLGQILGLFLVLSFSASSVATHQKEQRLVRVLQNDSSFKVRLQALRILTKRLRARPASISGKMIDVIGEVANEDAHYMVRGMACFVLGQLATSSSEKYLVTASQDSKAFVRVQAESALKLLAAKKSSSPATPPSMVATSTGTRALVFAVEAMPGAKIPKSMIDEMSTRMSVNLKHASNSSFTFFSEHQAHTAHDARPGGYKIRSSIAERSLTREEGSQLRISIVVRVTITTWPGNNLRHVISAKASGTVRQADPRAIQRVERQVLAGAVDQAVLDIMAEISRS
jgi:hypothetical protein